MQLNNPKQKAKEFEKLVRKYQGLVYSIIFAITSENDVSFDLTQEVFIKAFNEERLFDEDFKEKSWLAKVARNEALTYQRSFKRKINYLLRFCSLMPQTDSDSLLEKLIQEQEFIELRELLAKLKEEERELVSLRYSAGLSYQEIAEVLNIKIGTVMSRLSRLKDKLGTMITEKENG